MKKIAVVSALFLVLANSALAYENIDVGFTLKNNYCVLDSSNNAVIDQSVVDLENPKIAKTYKFICKENQENASEHMHTINLVSNENARKIFGEKFSTSYFNEQFEKLDLLKRSELSLKTIPLAIWNLDKYVDEGIALPYSELGINKMEEVKSFLNVEKVAKYNIITISHLYKQNRKLFALNTSLVSNYDKLFILSSYNVDTKTLLPKEDENFEEVPLIMKRLQEKEEAKVTNLTPAELDTEVRNQIWEEHLKFVKSFKIKR